MGGAADAKSATGQPPATTAEEVIARNVAARGGLSAWQRVDTMVWLGHVERAGSTERPMRFVIQLKRPNLTRFEIAAPSGAFTRVFDGMQGWKLRPTGAGPPDLKAFSKEESQFARDEFVIDGPLIDYQARGTTAHFDGVDLLDGRRAYRLSLKLRSGAERTVWIDTKTALELRYDRPSTSPLSPGARVSVYYRDYASFDGLKIPRVIEFASVKGQPQGEGVDKLVIDKVLVNPQLGSEAFMRPQLPGPRHPGGVTTRTTPTTAASPAEPRP